MQKENTGGNGTFLQRQKQIPLSGTERLILWYHCFGAARPQPQRFASKFVHQQMDHFAFATWKLAQTPSYRLSELGEFHCTAFYLTLCVKGPTKPGTALFVKEALAGFKHEI